LRHDPGWVRKGEAIQVRGRCFAGAQETTALANLTIRCRLFSEKRDTFCFSGEPLSMFRAGGELEWEGEAVSDDSGSFAVESGTRGHGKNEVYRLEARTPWGVGGALVVHVVKRPLLSSIEVDERVLREGESCSGKVFVRDPLGRPVPGAILQISMPGQDNETVMTGHEGRGRFRFHDCVPGRLQVACEGGPEVLPSEEEVVVLSASGSLDVPEWSAGIVHGFAQTNEARSLRLFAWHGSLGPAACVVRAGNGLLLRESAPPGGTLLEGAAPKAWPVLADLVFFEDGGLAHRSLYLSLPAAGSRGVDEESGPWTEYASILERRSDRRGCAALLGSSSRHWISPVKVDTAEEGKIAPSSPITASQGQEWVWVPERLEDRPAGITGQSLASSRASEEAMREQMSRSGLFPASNASWRIPPNSPERTVYRKVADRSRYAGSVRLDGSNARLALDPVLQKQEGGVRLWFGGSLSDICAAGLRPLADVLIGEERLLYLLLLARDSSDLLDGLSFFQSVDGGWRWPGEEKSDPLLTCLLLATPALRGESTTASWSSQRAMTYLKERNSEPAFQAFTESFERWRTTEWREGTSPSSPPAESLSVRTWGPLAAPLRTVAGLKYGDAWGDMERCGEAALDPETDPLLRALWCLAVRSLEGTEKGMEDAPPRLKVNGKDLTWEPGGLEGVYEAACPPEVLSDRMSFENRSALSGWIVAACPQPGPAGAEQAGQDAGIRRLKTEFWKDGRPLEAPKGIYALKRGELVERKISIVLPGRCERVVLHDTVPNGLSPLGDWRVNGSPSLASFGERGVSFRIQGCEQGPLECSFRLVAEHCGLFAHEGAWLVAWGPSALEAYAPPVSIQID